MSRVLRMRSYRGHYGRLPEVQRKRDQQVEEGATMNNLDYIVRCGDERINVHIVLDEARRSAKKASLDRCNNGRLVVIERCGRVIEQWDAGQRRDR